LRWKGAHLRAGRASGKVASSSDRP
jgi:hypothetical protein